MKKVKKWRYYCDFCKKSGGSSFHMRNHEIGCTANPDRKCGLCEKMGLEQKPISDLIALIGNDGDENLKALREATDNCPACILAAIRQSKVNEIIFDEEGYADHPGYIVFDFKKELEVFWAEYNSGLDNY